MTSRINPPGGSPLPLPAPARSLDGVSGAASASAAASSSSRSFAEVAASASPSGASAAPPHQIGESAAASTPVGTLAGALSRGEIDATEAVSALVSRALDSPMAAALTDRGRERLAAHLRDNLTNDPTLAGMVRDLERGS